DLDVGRDSGLHIGQCSLDPLHDIPGGGIGAFGDRNVDRALTVNQGIAGSNVGAETDSSDVADIDGRPAAEPQRYALEVLHVFDHAVLGGEIRGIADADVSCRSNTVEFDKGLHDLVGRQVIPAY